VLGVMMGCCECEWSVLALLRDSGVRLGPILLGACQILHDMAIVNKESILCFRRNRRCWCWRYKGKERCMITESSLKKESFRPVLLGEFSRDDICCRCGQIGRYIIDSRDAETLTSKHSSIRTGIGILPLVAL